MYHHQTLKKYRDSLKQRLLILVKDTENNKDAISDVKVEIKKIDAVLIRAYTRS